MTKHFGTKAESILKPLNVTVKVYSHQDESENKSENFLFFDLFVVFRLGFHSVWMDP